MSGAKPTPTQGASGKPLPSSQRPPRSRWPPPLPLARSTSTAARTSPARRTSIPAAGWKECSFQLDASLTKEVWRQFTREAGMVVYFRPMADARPMGKGSFEFAITQWTTGIDDADAAWNDTFVHPDSAHWLFEGSGLAFPGLTVRAGVTNTTDVTLAQLAERLDTTPHKLSDVLNAQVGQTFYDFVNGYRVREVQRCIKAGEAKKLKMLALALDAGFASKSTFNEVFKKHTNLTPSAFQVAITGNSTQR